MAEHVRNCDCCKNLQECSHAVAIIAGYPGEILIDALLDGQKPEHNKKQLRTYRNEYMRRWRVERKNRRQETNG